MKCDVCYSMIPVGKNRCPNCGYNIKKKSIIRSSTLEFDHIEEEGPKPVFNHIDTKAKMPSFDHIGMAGPKRRQQQRIQNSGGLTNKDHFSVLGFIIGLIMLYYIYTFIRSCITLM